MGHRLSKIVTRTGDDGSTGLGDGARVSKISPVVEAIGTVDELSSMLGVVIAHLPSASSHQSWLQAIQNDLFNVGGELSIPGHTLVMAASVEKLEEKIEAINTALPPLKDFILPGGTPLASWVHVARSLCRRAERRVLSLHGASPINPETLKYLNRLSDLLFVFARTVCLEAGKPEILWQRN